MRLFLTLFISTLTLAVASAANWPEFRGPNGDGHSTSNDPPVKWSETSNVRWKTAIHGKGWSSPVIWANQVWMTTATPDGKELFAVCVDRESGKIVHDLKVFTVEKPQFCHAFNSYASPTPAIEAGRVYVHFGSPGTACIDTATGKTLWEQRDLPCDHFRGAGSSPVIVGNLLVLTFDGFDYQYVAGLDKNTGKVVWKRDKEIQYSTSDGDYKKAYSTPAVLKVNGQTQLVSPSAEATIALDPATGDELWRVVHGGMNASSRPVTGHGLVYLTSGHTANLLGIKLGDKGSLTENSIAWKVKNGVPTRSSLLLVGDLLFMVNDGGIASCLDAKTGERRWQQRLGKAYSASPVHAAGHIYCADEEGKTHVVKASPTFEIESVNELEAGCMGSPAIVDNAVYLRTKTHIYRLELPK